jgi:hypothetical protein
LEKRSNPTVSGAAERAGVGVRAISGNKTVSRPMELAWSRPAVGVQGRIF